MNGADSTEGLSAEQRVLDMIGVMMFRYQLG